MPRNRAGERAPLRCPRCGAEAGRLARCPSCRRLGCEETCVPNGDGTICVRCAGTGDDADVTDDEDEDRDEEE
jgi:hypothetical protein